MQVTEFGGDNRAGIDRCLHRISCIRNRDGRIVGLTCRVGRAVAGSANLVADVVLSGRSLLLLGRPGVGKTTAIRDISRMLAVVAQKRVVIVDTSNEIAGDGNVPHPAIDPARRMQVKFLSFAWSPVKSHHTTPHHTIPHHTTPHPTIPHHPSPSLTMHIMQATA